MNDTAMNLPAIIPGFMYQHKMVVIWKASMQFEKQTRPICSMQTRCDFKP
jgi:hypothetical protein